MKMLVRVNVSPEEGADLQSRDSNLEHVMTSVLHKLQLLERKEQENSDINFIKDFLPENFGFSIIEDKNREKMTLWLTEVFNQNKVLKEKLLDLEENNKSLSVLNTDLIRRNHTLENQHKILLEKLSDNSLVKTKTEMKHLNEEEIILPESLISQSQVVHDSEKEPLLESNTGVCDHCLQIIYPVHSYSNINLENNQLKYQNIHLESQKLSLEFQNRILKQEVSKLKDSSKCRLGSQIYSQIDDDLSSLEKVIDLVDDNDGICDIAEKNEMESESQVVFAIQDDINIKNVRVGKMDNCTRNDDSEVKNLKMKISQLKYSKSVLKKRTRELLSEYRKKRESLHLRDEQVHSYKAALVKLKSLHIELQHSHAAILECIKAELEAVVECIEKENIRESLSSKIKTAKGDEEENCEGVSVVSNYSEDQKCSRLSTKERNNSVITIQTLIGLIKSLISQG